jgi:hypothetical protein
MRKVYIYRFEMNCTVKPSLLVICFCDYIKFLFFVYLFIFFFFFFYIYVHTYIQFFIPSNVSGSVHLQGRLEPYRLNFPIKRSCCPQKMKF